MSLMPGGTRNGIGRLVGERDFHEILDHRRRQRATGLAAAERAGLS